MKLKILDGSEGGQKTRLFATRAHSVVAQKIPSIKPRLVVFVPRANSWHFTISSGSAIHQKRDVPKDISFLAQKAGFEPALRFSHTTPLAGEPLEPLGYFCMAQYQLFIQKAILLYHIFFALPKLFTLKNKKSFLFFARKTASSKRKTKDKKFAKGYIRYAINNVFVYVFK